MKLDAMKITDIVAKIILLKYFICDTEVPEPEMIYNTFTNWAIARAPLDGANFEADACCVHQLLTSFIQGQPAENWTLHLVDQQDGRQDWLALKHHYTAEGNALLLITEVEKLKNSLS